MGGKGGSVMRIRVKRVKMKYRWCKSRDPVPVSHPFCVFPRGTRRTHLGHVLMSLEHIKEIGEDRVLLSCSTSACEHILSIEGWIHSNRKNRFGQNLVERLVRTHTNLKLEQRLEMYESGLLPWDIEMTVKESVSDDDDGPPHRVSDSESE
jgi:hypothetical protein